MRQFVERWILVGALLASTQLGCGGRSTLALGDHSVGGEPSDGFGGSSGAAVQSASGATTSGAPDPGDDLRKLDKLDILLAVDDSISMADKQHLLRQGVPDLIGRLANPLCVDGARRPYPDLTPAAGQACPAGPDGQPLDREFLPVLDVHVGLVTSSLGNAGGTGPSSKTDQAHLLGSLDRGQGLPGMTPEGFLAWDPETPQETFESEVAQMVEAAGESGGGFESSLEAWLRFLVDPAPHERLVKVPCSPDAVEPGCVEKLGIDNELLGQRRAFLRPDSVVVILVLSDEDDCSASAEPKSWEIMSSTRVARGSSVCDFAPNDPCCYSCGAEPPTGCEPDPICLEQPLVPSVDDQSNLRCFEQKRRFGRDVLYPIARYENALTQPVLCPARTDLSPVNDCSQLVENPLFMDLARGGPAVRTPAAVFLTFIVGVPWQDLATEPLMLLDPGNDALSYKSPAELARDGSWDLLIGDSIDPPRDPLMLQSVDIRAGVHPITGDVIAGPEAWPITNRINGHDRTIPSRDDLQYACTFPLPEVRDCQGQRPCDCSDPVKGISPDNPMCQDPVTGVYSTLQHSGKAYPGQRHVRLARELGQNAVLSSICARNTNDPSRADYAYRPAVSALISRIAPILKQPD